MISDDELTRAGTALHERFGAEIAGEFGRSLPGVVAELAQRWDLHLGGLLDSGATSVVLEVTRASGSAVLKLSPDTDFLARQVQMLERLAPTGRVPRVLMTEPGAVVMERIVPGSTLDSDRANLPSPADWATLLRDLHSASPDGITDDLSDRCEDMFARVGARQANPKVRAHVCDELWQRTVEAGRELVSSSPDRGVIHGDLHLGNVLLSDDRGLVAIDPKLCVGDRSFDMVDFVIADGGPAEMATRARDLAGLAGMDPERLLSWSRVNAVVTAVSRLTWHGPGSRSDTLLAFGSHH